MKVVPISSIFKGIFMSIFVFFPSFKGFQKFSRLFSSKIFIHFNVTYVRVRVRVRMQKWIKKAKRTLIRYCADMWRRLIREDELIFVLHISAKSGFKIGQKISSISIHFIHLFQSAAYLPKRVQFHQAAIGNLDGFHTCATAGSLAKAS